MSESTYVRTTMTSSNKAHLHIVKIGKLSLHALFRKSAETGHVLPGMTNSSLLSIGQLRDNECVVVFDELHLDVYSYTKITFKGMCHVTDGLWDIKINKYKNSLHTMNRQNSGTNTLIRKDQIKPKLADYLNAYTFSPALLSFQQAIWKNNFVTWPAISTINLKFFLEIQNLFIFAI